MTSSISSAVGRLAAFKNDNRKTTEAAHNSSQAHHGIKTSAYSKSIPALLPHEWQVSCQSIFNPRRL